MSYPNSQTMTLSSSRRPAVAPFSALLVGAVVAALFTVAAPFVNTAPGVGSAIGPLFGGLTLLSAPYAAVAFLSRWGAVRKRKGFLLGAGAMVLGGGFGALTVNALEAVSLAPDQSHVLAEQSVDLRGRGASPEHVDAVVEMASDVGAMEVLAIYVGVGLAGGLVGAIAASTLQPEGPTGTA